MFGEGRGYSGQVTPEPRGETSAPMGTELTGPAILREEGGHLRDKSEAPGQPGCSAGDFEC